MYTRTLENLPASPTDLWTPVSSYACFCKITSIIFNIIFLTFYQAQLYDCHILLMSYVFLLLCMSVCVPLPVALHGLCTVLRMLISVAVAVFTSSVCKFQPSPYWSKKTSRQRTTVWDRLQKALFPLLPTMQLIAYFHWTLASLSVSMFFISSVDNTGLLLQNLSLAEINLLCNLKVLCGVFL